jgi:hypothetical protein
MFVKSFPPCRKSRQGLQENGYCFKIRRIHKTYRIRVRQKFTLRGTYAKNSVSCLENLNALKGRMAFVILPQFLSYGIVVPAVRGIFI